MTIERIGFAYNPTNEAAVELSARASGWCQVRGLGEWQAQSGDLDRLRHELPSTDALVVLGGDGTFLRAACSVADLRVPILGVNLGKVGFLSKAEHQDLPSILAQLKAGDYDAAFFLRPTPVEQVREVAAAGETMPPKSTYFVPKVPTGIVFNPSS